MRDPYEPDPSVPAPKFVELERSFEGGLKIPAFIERQLEPLERGTEIVMWFLVIVLFGPVLLPVWVIGRIWRKR